MRGRKGGRGKDLSYRSLNPRMPCQARSKAADELRCAREYLSIKVITDDSDIISHCVNKGTVCLVLKPGS